MDHYPVMVMLECSFGRENTTDTLVEVGSNVRSFCDSLEHCFKNMVWPPLQGNPLGHTERDVSDFLSRILLKISSVLWSV